MATISNIAKSKDFGKDENTFVVLTFVKSSSHGSNSPLATACLNNSSAYTASFDLARLYSDLIDRDTDTLDCAAAYKAFRKDYHVGDAVDIDCYDIAISEISDFAGVQLPDKRIMEVMHPALFGTREDAVILCQRNLARQIVKKQFKPLSAEEVKKLRSITAKTKDDDEDEE